MLKYFPPALTLGMKHDVSSLRSDRDVAIRAQGFKWVIKYDKCEISVCK